MATPTTLAAVLFVELADFTDFMSSDESAAVVVLSAYRRAVDPIIAEHHGDIVDSTGSELLVVFTSAVAAVQCSLHLSLMLLPFGAALGYPGKAEARIGVHLGEIWRDEGRVYGNGVNVAARVMQAAPAGALFLSEDVYRQVSGKLDLTVREVGGVELKNIERPMALYEVDAGRGFSGPEAGKPAKAAAVTGAERPPAGDSVRPSGEPRDDRPPGPGVTAGRPHGHRENSSPSTSKLARELRESITREVREALASATVSEVHDGAGKVMTIDLGSKRSHTSKADASRLKVDSTGDDEAARDRAAGKANDAVKSLIMSGGIGAALGYGYFATGKWLFAAGAVLIGLLPFLSSLKKLLAASADIRLIDKREKRKSVGR